MTDKQTTRLNPTALGLALGLLWGGGLVVLGLISRGGWGERLREAIGEAYIGYDETNTGLAIGAVWGFLDALVGGILLGWLYNAFDRKS